MRTGRASWALFLLGAWGLWIAFRGDAVAGLTSGTGGLQGGGGSVINTSAPGCDAGSFAVWNGSQIICGQVAPTCNPGEHLLFDGGAFGCSRDAVHSVDSYGNRFTRRCATSALNNATFVCDTGSSMGAAGTCAAVDLGSKQWIRCTCATGVGNTCGPLSANSQTQVNHLPRGACLMRTDSTIDSRRAAFGLESASPTTWRVDAGAYATAAEFFVVAFETTFSPNFTCCTGNGTQGSCSDMGVPVETDTEYWTDAELQADGGVRCAVRKAGAGWTTTYKTTHVPSTSSVTDLFAACGAANTDAGQRFTYTHRFELETE